MLGFRHVDLAVADLQDSIEFYSQFLALLGWTCQRETITGERGEQVVYLASEALGQGGSLGLRQATVQNPIDRYHLGLHHLAFNSPSRGAVNQVGQWARRRALTDEGPPRSYYSGHYYAYFFRDPQNIKLEVVHRPAYHLDKSG